MPNVKANDVINAVIKSSTTLSEGVPLASDNRAASLQTTGQAIMSYTPFMNEFINGLVNRIAVQEAHNRVYQNPLRVFKGTDIPFGTDVQECIANPAIATPYDSTAMSDILTPAVPDVKCVYYRRNRQDKYKLTVYDAELEGAFLNSERFGNFVSMLVNTLTSGDNIDEFQLMKGLITTALNDSNIGATTITNNSDDPEAFARQLVTNAKAKYTLFGFPSTEYNCYEKMAKAAGISSATPLTTWSTPDRISILIRADVAAVTDVDVLAKAFNLGKTEFLGRQIVVDSFGEGDKASKTLAVLLDNSAIRVHDNRYTMADDFYNAATLSRTYYLHHWQTMAFSPLANAWAFQEA